MGELAEAVLQAGGEVIGIEPGFFVDSCLQHDGITQLIVTETMAERKEVRLGHNDKPCIVFNLDGYYEPLRQMLDVMVREGFLDEESRSSFLFLPDVESIARALE